MTALEEIKKALEGVTPGPWKAVSEPHFDSGLVYTSVQPVNIDEETMKPLAMANGEYHVCRMSHSAAPWRFNYHRANARYIAAVNPVAISELLSTLESLQRENAVLKIDASNHAADAETVRREREVERRRAEAAEAALKPFVAFFDKAMAGFTEGYSDRHPDKIICGVNGAELSISAFIAARHALASTGGEHNAE